jgi:hypothetical protein
MLLTACCRGVRAQEEHAKANTDAATHEHVPPRLIVVYVVDKNAGLGPFNPSKVNAAATERNKVEMRANFKRKLSGVLTSASGAAVCVHLARQRIAGHALLLTCRCCARPQMR